MKLVLKNTDLVFKTQAQLVKCYETTRTADDQGRLNVAINLSTVDAGTNILAFKCIKDNSGTPTTYVLYKADKGGASGVVSLDSAVPFGQLTQAYDLTGSGSFKIYKTGFTSGDSFTIEVYKYDV